MESYFGALITKRPPKKAAKLNLFESTKFFLKLSRQNTTEAFRKHLMAKKVRIRAWQESEDSAINMANHLGLQGHLGHQKLKKEYFAGPCFLCPGGSLASSRMGQTCPKT
jgi:hypothetical protein